MKAAWWGTTQLSNAIKTHHQQKGVEEMKKHEFIRTVAEKTGLPQIAVGDVLSGIIETVKEELETTNESKLPGIGTFKVVFRAERTAVNPRTGERITVPEKAVLKFKIQKGF